MVELSWSRPIFNTERFSDNWKFLKSRNARTNLNKEGRKPGISFHEFCFHYLNSDWFHAADGLGHFRDVLFKCEPAEKNLAQRPGTVARGKKARARRRFVPAISGQQSPDNFPAAFSGIERQRVVTIGRPNAIASIKLPGWFSAE